VEQTFIGFGAALNSLEVAQPPVAV